MIQLHCIIISFLLVLSLTLLLIDSYFSSHSSILGINNAEGIIEFPHSSSIRSTSCGFKCNHMENSGEQDHSTTSINIKRGLNQFRSSLSPFVGATESDGSGFALLGHQNNILKDLTEEDYSKLQKVYDNVVDSVVSIITPRGSHGSGFIIDKSGHILTNYHVAGDESTVVVRLFNNNEYNAIVIGKDKYSDSAVLQIDPRAINFENLQPLLFAKSTSIHNGDPIIAIGTPLDLSASSTWSKGRVIDSNNLDLHSEYKSYIVNEIVINAPINAGNSGGPLLNLQGKVIGMIWGSAGSNGVYGVADTTLDDEAVAIPSNTLLKIVPHLIKYGSYSHPWLGIDGKAISNGILVTSVIEGSPASFVGIHSYIATNGKPAGDIITEIDNIFVKSPDEIISHIETKSVGDSVTLTVLRNENAYNVEIQLAEKP